MLMTATRDRSQLDQLQLNNLRELRWAAGVIEAHQITTCQLKRAEQVMQLSTGKSSEAQEKAEM